MKTYGEMEVALSTTPFPEFIRSLEAVKAVAWQRAESLEKSLASTTGGDMACFEFSPDQANSPLPAALVWMSFKKDASLAWVTNIVPRERRKLTEDEYNDLLDRFRMDVIQPVAVRLSLPVTRSKRDPSLEDLINPETAGALRRFSACANKSTGSSHPCDLERWNQFLFLYHRKRDKLDPTLLGEFLMEDGWSEDMAHELVAEFERGVDLLRNYDPTRLLHA